MCSLKKMLPFCAALGALLFSACSQKTLSTLSAQGAERPLALVALNRGARTACIENPQKSSYLYFAFDAETSFEQSGRALEIQVRALSGGAGAEGAGGASAGTENAAANAEAEGASAQSRSPRFCFGWLYDEDFADTYRLNKTLGAHSFVSGEKFPVFKVSLAFPEKAKVRGFFVYADTPLAVESAVLTQVKTGWLCAADSVPWFGFTAAGGIIGDSCESLALTAEGAMKFSLYLAPYEANAAAQNTAPVKLNVAGTPLAVLQAPNQNKLTFYPSLLAKGGGSLSAQINENAAAVAGMVFEPVLPSSAPTPLAPIVTDPGLIPDWPQSAWRRSDFEVFAWEQFPYVLFFDTRDYDVQDKLFKRLAFFAEKAGYTGKLVSDAVMAGQHGFNAHDYRAETLADFFELARVDGFPLNEHELLLRDILVGHGIITVRGDGSYAPGFGALVSISQELGWYLRRMLLVHEGLHCLYFTNSEFRAKVAEVYEQTDYRSLQFLLKYFSVTASLNYDIKDTYLIQNEFMSYMMQQSLGEVAEYFTNVLATKKTINATNPELVQYILDTNATGFTASAAKLDAFLRQRWNYAGGRIWLVTVGR